MYMRSKKNNDVAENEDKQRRQMNVGTRSRTIKERRELGREEE